MLFVEKDFAHISGVSRHRDTETRGKKKLDCTACGRHYSFFTNLCEHINTHHPQASQPGVLRQTSLDANIVTQLDSALSSDTSHRPFAFSTSVPCTEPSSDTTNKPSVYFVVFRQCAFGVFVHLPKTIRNFATETNY